jgi:membrane associated rhomboid family serine protease
MFQSILDDVKREFRYGNMVTRLIILNCAVFMLVNIVKLILKAPDPSNPIPFLNFLHFFCMPGDVWELVTHPWTLLTSGFLHESFGHILWNMLAFYWFGRIVGDLLGNHRILPIYILGAIVGNLMFFIMANVSPYSIGSYALGASAAVMAMVACAAFVAPDYIFNVLLIGPIKLKYIALVLIFLDVIAIADNYNAGGSFAHLGGAAFGVLYASQLQKGIDLGKPLSKLIDFIGGLFNKQSKKNFNYQKGEKTYTNTKSEKTGFNTSTKGNSKSDTAGGSSQEKLDLILDKIKEKGYESLTKEEKEFLFNASKK